MTDYVLLSGGLDSSTLLAQVQWRSTSRPVAISIQYPSKHMSHEYLAANKVAKHFAVELRTLYAPAELWNDSDSVLLAHGGEIPHVSYEELARTDGPSPTVVPFRNAVFLSMAVALAASRGGGTVWIAVHASDHGRWAYPDCSPEFLGAFAAAAYVGTYHKVRVAAPFLHYSKAEVVKIGFKSDLPFKLTWSCYDPTPSRGVLQPECHFVHCGVCPTCLERKEAFKNASVEDPTEYAR